MVSLATKIDRAADLIEAIGRLEAIAMSAQLPSTMGHLNNAKNAAGYELAKLRAQQHHATEKPADGAT